MAGGAFSVRCLTTENHAACLACQDELEAALTCPPKTIATEIFAQDFAKCFGDESCCDHLAQTNNYKTLIGNWQCYVCGPCFDICKEEAVYGGLCDTLP